MFFMLDNYDSFVYNLAFYLKELGREVTVCRADRFSPEEVLKMEPEGILISPGPGRPQDAPESIELLKMAEGRIPVLGICLGHQIIGHFYGAKVCHGTRPVHGKVSSIEHDSSPIFRDIPEGCHVTRYHSLVVEEKSLPDVLRVNARSEDGVIMGLQHREKPVFGLQFHPEAVLTEHGHRMLDNFCVLCDDWSRKRRAEVTA